MKNCFITFIIFKIWNFKIISYICSKKYMFYNGISYMSPRNLKIKPTKSSHIEIFEEWCSLLEEKKFDIISNKISNGKLNAHDSLINDLTPLHIACIQGNTKAVKFLLDLGVNVDSESKVGRTPLDEALFYKHFTCVIELMKRQVKITKHDRKLILEQMV